MSDQRAPHARMLDLTYTSLVVHSAIHAATVLGIPDALAGRTRDSGSVARETGADPEATYRLLRALASAGVVAESEGRRFSLTELGATLRSDVPGSMRGWVLFSGAPFYLDAWRETPTSIRSGAPGWDQARGVPFFDYLSQNPEASDVFDAAMTSLSSWEAKDVVEAYDFSEIRRLVDVGGGQGQLLTAILEAYPSLQGVLFDQPRTVADGRLLAGAGVADRCTVAAGDFFEAVPAGADAYLLKYVVHDWDDERAVRILANCREAMTGGGRVILVETVVPGPGESHYAKFQDLEMLVLLGSRERTLDEFEVLLARAGLALAAAVPTAGYLSILEAVRRQPASPASP